MRALLKKTLVWSEALPVHFSRCLEELKERRGGEKERYLKTHWTSVKINRFDQPTEKKESQNKFPLRLSKSGLGELTCFSSCFQFYSFPIIHHYEITYNLFAFIKTKTNSFTHSFTMIKTIFGVPIISRHLSPKFACAKSKTPSTWRVPRRWSSWCCWSGWCYPRHSAGRFLCRSWGQKGGYYTNPQKKMRDLSQ